MNKNISATDIIFAFTYILKSVIDCADIDRKALFEKIDEAAKMVENPDQKIILESFANIVFFGVDRSQLQ